MDTKHSNYIEDKILVIEAKSNPDKYDCLFNKYLKPLVRYCALYVDWEDAKDIAQDTLLRGLMELPRIDPDNSFRGWIYRVAHNLCIDHIRKNKRERNTSIEAEFLQETYYDSTQFQKMKDTFSALFKCISLLLVKEQEVVKLRMNNLTLTEISYVIRLSISGVKKRLDNALEKLKDCLCNKGIKRL